VAKQSRCAAECQHARQAREGGAMSKKKETAQPNTNQTNTGNEVDPVASAERRKAENAELYPEE
jgi:hypothetical protein